MSNTDNECQEYTYEKWNSIDIAAPGITQKLPNGQMACMSPQLVSSSRENKLMDVCYGPATLPSNHWMKPVMSSHFNKSYLFHN